MIWLDLGVLSSLLQIQNTPSPDLQQFGCKVTASSLWESECRYSPLFAVTGERLDSATQYSPPQVIAYGSEGESLAQYLPWKSSAWGISFMGCGGVGRIGTFVVGGLGFVGAAMETVAKKVVRRKGVVGCIAIY